MLYFLFLSTIFLILRLICYILDDYTIFSINFDKLVGPTVATAKGHLGQERQGLQSTKQPLHLFTEKPEEIKEKIANLKHKFPTITGLQNLIEADIAADAFPQSNAPNIKTHEVAYSLVELPPKNIAYTDLTGRFPYRSSSGNEYIMVGYHFDGNVILGEPIKNRHANSESGLHSLIMKQDLQS